MGSELLILAGGAIGMPMGMWALAWLSPSLFKLVVGSILLVSGPAMLIVLKETRHMTHPTIAAWHEAARTRDLAALDALLADDAVFHSPVVHKPQAGRALTRMYLAAAFEVFINDSFRYVREIVGERDAVLEFQVEIDGIAVNGVDMIRWNDAGRIVDFKVMIRPLKAIDVVHRRMAAMLQAGR